MRRTVLLLVATALGMFIVGGVSFVAIDKPAHATFPGENGKIAFSAFGWGVDIFTINPDGSGETNLTENPQVSGSAPAWSPSGKEIAYAHAENNTLDIFVMDADGTNPRRLTDTPDTEWQPAWSPDGEQIAFTRLRDPTIGDSGEIYVMNADGSDQRRLTNTSSHEAFPDWSPDGKEIVFTSTRDNPEAEIYVMNADGSNQRRLTDDPWRNVSPSWSPDGSKIAYGSFGPQMNAVYVMNADGSDKTELTNTPYEGPPGPVCNSASYPAWSPDGTKIAFTERCEMYVMNADGSEKTLISQRGPLDIDWQPLPASEGPRSKAECKKGGYKEFGFKNQGQCIKAVKANT